MNTFLTVPEEVISSNILMSLSYDDLIKFCQTNQKYNHFCNNESIWKFLLKRDFAIIYNGDNAKSRYLRYNRVLISFSPHVKILTYAAFMTIFNYIPEKYWHILSNYISERRNKMYQISIPILNFGMLTSIVENLNYAGKIIPQIKDALLNKGYKDYKSLAEIGESILSCEDYLKIVNKVSLVFINNKLTTIDHDLDIYDLLPGYMSVECDDEEERIYNIYK